MKRTMLIVALTTMGSLVGCDSGDEMTDTTAGSSATTAGSSGSGGTSTATTSAGTGGETGGTSGGGPPTTIPTTQEPLLADVTAMLEASCQVDLISTIDWPSFEAHYDETPNPPVMFGEAEAVNYCAEILGQIEFQCRQVADIQTRFAAVGLAQIHCYWHEDLPKEGDTRENMIMDILPDGVQTWGMNWWSANLSDQVFGWLQEL